MHCLRTVSFILFSTVLLALTGCGGSSSSGNFNPVPAVQNSAPSTPSFSNTSSAAGKYAISLDVDRATIDANVGQVLATAFIESSNGVAVAGRPVTFSVAAGPATVVPSLVTVSTDSNGTALTVIAPGDVLTTTNVILMATATINGETIRAYAPFQIVRGSGVIKFITTKPTTDPDGVLFTLDEVVAGNFAGKEFRLLQEVPIKVTDGNGNPRVGVQVTLSVEDQLTGKAQITFSDQAATSATVTTDSAGSAIFNVAVKMFAPPVGVTHADSIIYKAVTTEDSGTPQLVSYAGFVVSMTTEAVPLVLAPGTVTLSAQSPSAVFTISGGVPPYRVTSSNDALVSLTQLDESTVRATLLTSTLLSAPVTISVTDGAGGSATATVTTAAPVPAAN